MVWGCFLGFGLDPLASAKRNVNAVACTDILDNFMIPTLWQQFVDGPFLFQHDNPPCSKQGP